MDPGKKKIPGAEHDRRPHGDRQREYDAADRPKPAQDVAKSVDIDPETRQGHRKISKSQAPAGVEIQRIAADGLVPPLAQAGAHDKLPALVDARTGSHEE